MTNTTFTTQDPVRLAELARMKLLATGLLLAMTAVYLASAYLEHFYYWASFVNATAEAAMIGAVADWFAVTALFRHPLGLKIPHTAIIPTRQNLSLIHI